MRIAASKSKSGRNRTTESGNPQGPRSGYLHYASKPDVTGASKAAAQAAPARPRKRPTRNAARDFHVANLKRLLVSLATMGLVLAGMYQFAKRAAAPRRRPDPPVRSAPAAPDVDADLLQDTLLAGSARGPTSKGELIRAAVDLVDEGKRLESQGLPEEALGKYLMAARLWPPVPDAMRLAGRIYMARGEHDRAVEALQAAMDQEPERLDIRTELGEAFLEMGRAQPAHETLRAVLERSPDYLPAYLPFARSLAQRGRASEAFLLVNRYLEETPDDAEGFYQLAMIEAGRGHLEEALAALETAVTLNPGNGALHMEAAAAAALLQRFDQALAFLREAERRESPLDVFVTLRKTAFDQFRRTEAGRAYDAELMQRAREAQEAQMLQ